MCVSRIAEGFALLLLNIVLLSVISVAVALALSI